MFLDCLRDSVHDRRTLGPKKNTENVKLAMTAFLSFEEGFPEETSAKVVCVVVCQPRGSWTQQTIRTLWAVSTIHRNFFGKGEFNGRLSDRSASAFA